MKAPTAKHVASMPPALRTDFFRLEQYLFAGYVVDENDLNRRFVVELFVDGQPVKVVRADAYTSELAIESIGDACYGFAFSLHEQAVDHGSVVEARLANSDIAVGTPIALKAREGAERASPPGDEIRWLGGLRFDGWCIGDREEAPTVAAIVDGERVAEARASRWANIGNPGEARLARRFDLYLPERFADGRVRRVQFVRDNDEDFPGSPLTIVAYDDGLSRSLHRLGGPDAELLRAVQFDRMLPMAWPLSDYAQWRERFPFPAGGDGDTAPLAIALVGPGDPQPSLDSLGNAGFSDWVAAALPESGGRTAFAAEDLMEFLNADAANSDYVVLTHCGARFSAEALQRIAGSFRAFPDAIACYGDFDLDGGDGSWPVLLPAFDYERLLEQGYCAHLFALRREKALAAAATGATDLYRLFLSALEEVPAGLRNIVHLPGSLVTLDPRDVAADAPLLAAAVSEHLRGREVAAQVSEAASSVFPAVRVARSRPQGSTTIVIPVRDQIGLLRACLQSIQPAVTDGKVDIMIVDNDSADPETIDFLDNLNSGFVTVVAVPGAFNFARLNNVAAEYASGDFLCFLNNDVNARDADWLDEMLGRLNETDVGAVGALLLWPTGVVQHAGTVLGPNFAAAHAFNDRIDTDPGYADMLRTARECSAVTAACLLTRRRDYLDVGGMDELNFPINFNDVDYCLKLRTKGKRIVFTPYARLSHLESASRGQDTRPDLASRFARELQNLRTRWGDHLVADPYYSPALSLDAMPFSALAWPPRSREPRLAAPPRPVKVPPGF